MLKTLTMILLTLVCGLALPAYAQSRDDYRVRCAAGDQVACAVQRAFDNAASKVTTKGTASVPTETQTTPAPRTARVENTAVIASQDQPATSQEGTNTLSWWQWILIIIGGYAIFHLIIKAVAKSGDVVREEKTKQAVYEEWSKPALKRPEFKDAERDLFYGDLMDRSPDTSMIVHWDRTSVFEWLDRKILELEPKVKNADILKFAQELKNAPNEKPRHHDAALAYCKNIERDELAWYGGQDAVDIGYYAAVGARYCVPWGAYYSSGFVEVGDWADGDKKLLRNLYRMAADLDMPPAAVNWAHAESLLQEKDINSELLTDVPVREAYLRHFFELGAESAHYQVSISVVDFYLYAPFQRPDHGFVAAAMDRLRQYDYEDHMRWVERYKEGKYTYDLKDQTIHRGGMLKELAEKLNARLQ